MFLLGQFTHHLPHLAGNIVFMASSDNLTYGFLDESPNLKDQAYFFCVAILLPDNPNPAHFQHIFKKIRQRELGKQKKQIFEIKFSNSSPRIKRKVLELISKEKITVYAFVVDREKRRIVDTPENYGIIMGFAAGEVLKNCHALILTPDKKYTRPIDQAELERTTLKVVSKVSRAGALMLKEPADSKRNSLIQMADFIAGSLNFKYNHEDDTYWQIIKDLIIKEKVESWTKLKAIVLQK